MIATRQKRDKREKAVSPLRLPTTVYSIPDGVSETINAANRIIFRNLQLNRRITINLFKKSA